MDKDGDYVKFTIDSVKSSTDVAINDLATLSIDPTNAKLSGKITNHAGELIKVTIKAEDYYDAAFTAAKA